MSEPFSLTGTVAALYRYPVKSMAGELLQAVDCTPAGLLGDRAYALIDQDEGTVVSAKNVRKWPNLLLYRAVFEAPPTPGDTPPPVRLRLPDGTEVSSEDPEVDGIVSRSFGRSVRLSSTPPFRPVLEQYHPEGDLVTREAMPSQTFFDLAPVHLLTTATLDRIRELSPTSNVTAERFRPNVVLRLTGGSREFPEQHWGDVTLLLGNTIKLKITADCFRCVMTTLCRTELPPDRGILRSVTDHNRGRVGVYASVLQGGRLQQGDPVEVLLES